MDKNELYQNIIDRHQNRDLYIINNKCHLVENKEVVEIIDFDDNNFNDIDNIYIGKVDKIISKNNIAFVDIGQSKNAFLPLQELPSYHELNNYIVKQGDSILVQIKKTAYGDKGAFLTRDIKIPGNFVMLMPFNNYIAISNRIENDKAKEELKDYAKNRLKGKYGIVFRKNAETLDFSNIESEINQQIDIIEKIINYYKNIKAPKCIYKSENNYDSLILDLLKLPGVLRVFTNSNDILFDLKKKFDNLDVSFVDKKEFNVKNSRKKHSLENGGNIVIDVCEALTVIDVNTASALVNNDENEIAITNMLATEEIVNNIKLNNMSGIIIIDYINMNDEDSKLIEKLLSILLKNDRNKCVVHGYTNLGLMELTRKRNITK